MRCVSLIGILVTSCLTLQAQTSKKFYILADRVFDGEVMHDGWAVVVDGDKIVAIGPRDKVAEPPGATKITRPNSTLLPGLIEGHTHLFLYPYNITDWDTQVLKESDSYRTARATVHAKNTLMAGFTTARDLGTEGAGYSDVGLKRAINEGLIPGPRLIVATRAIVATGAYGPKGYDTDMEIMMGAEEADGPEVVRVVRSQIGKGADFIKVYADYHWQEKEESRPTFSLEEIKAMVDAAASAGRAVVAHAVTTEGIKRAVLAGVQTIEHGDHVDFETARLMKDHNVTFIPTLAVGESLERYKGWVKGKMAEPERITAKKKSFAEALRAGVTIGMGGDVGVFTHGENVLEMELMVEYGMQPLDVMKSATSINAKAFHIDGELGSIKPGMKADLIVISGDPTRSISNLRKVMVVMKDGIIYRNDQ